MQKYPNYKADQGMTICVEKSGWSLEGRPNVHIFSLAEECKKFLSDYRSLDGSFKYMDMLVWRVPPHIC